MSVKVTIEDMTGNMLGQFIANATQSISQQAENYGIDIPVSCCHGACFVCNCEIKKGNEFIKIDTLTTPSVLPKRNTEGQFTEVFACVWWIQADAIKDSEEHEVVLVKQI